MLLEGTVVMFGVAGWLVWRITSVGAAEPQSP